MEALPSLRMPTRIASQFERFPIRMIICPNRGATGGFHEYPEKSTPKKFLPLMVLCVLVWGCPGEPDQITEEAQAEAEEPASTDTGAAADTEPKMDAAVATAAEGTKEGLETAGDGLKTAGEATQKAVTTAGEATKKGVTAVAKTTVGALTKAAEATKKAVTPGEKDKTPDPDQDR